MITTERLKASVEIDANGCWIWKKAVHWNGYGKVGIGGGKTATAHRTSYRAFVGEIPPGMDVCHRCDVRACINPDHLFLGTRSENIQDAKAKGRLRSTPSRTGSAHPAAKLTEADIPVIRARLAAGEGNTSIAADYGVTPPLIGHIKHGRAWRHVAIVASISGTDQFRRAAA